MNKWIPAENVDKINGPCFAIYKHWAADCNDFSYVLKAMSQYNSTRDLVLNNSLRCAMIMPVDPRNLAEVHLPRIIEQVAKERAEGFEAELYGDGMIKAMNFTVG